MIFYNFDKFQQNNNITIKIHNLQKDNIIWKSNKNHIDYNYFSNTKNKLYHRSTKKGNTIQSLSPNQQTHCNDQIILHQPTKIYNRFENVNHNFTAFNINNKYIGIGGTEDIVFYESDDGINWNLTGTIIPQEHKSIFGKDCHGFDSMPSLLYINNTYYLYHRANLNQGVRHICYATSKDMKEWSEFKLVNFVNKPFNTNKDSYYISNFSKYPGIDDLYIGLTPYSLDNTKNRWIVLFLSTDGINWTFIGSVTNRMSFILPVVQELEEVDGKYNQYIHDYYGETITKYSIDKDRFIGLYSENGTLLTKLMETVDNKIIVNYVTYNDGYIEIDIYDENMNKIKNERLVSNCIEHEIHDLTNAIYIGLKIVNSELFSIL